jgi:hypothetical protein
LPVQAYVANPNFGLEMHCATQSVGGIDSVEIDLFDVSVRIAEFAAITEELGQCRMDPK